MFIKLSEGEVLNLDKITYFYPNKTSIDFYTERDEEDEEGYSPSYGTDFNNEKEMYVAYWALIRAIEDGYPFIDLSKFISK